MAKIKSAFFCNSCGHESAKWIGKCPGCNNWNTFVEEILEKKSKTLAGSFAIPGTSKPQLIQEVVGFKGTIEHIIPNQTVIP